MTSEIDLAPWPDPHDVFRDGGPAGTGHGGGGWDGFFSMDPLKCRGYDERIFYET